MTISKHKLLLSKCEKSKNERERIEKELDEITKISPKTTKLLTDKGFFEYYMSMRNWYPTYLDAYEVLEEYYLRLSGKRRFSDYVSMCRFIRKMRTKIE